MKSATTESSWKLFARLPKDVRQQAYRAYGRFEQDPFHPGLNFEEVNKRKGLWSVRINDNYRVLGYRKDDSIQWFWVGTHSEYLRLIHAK